MNKNEFWIKQLVKHLNFLMRYHTWCFVLITSISGQVLAQASFDQLVSTGNIKADFERNFQGETVFGDIDGDGDLDAVLCGYRSEIGANPIHQTNMYLNDGSGNFSRVTGHGITDFIGVPNLADINGDTRLDLIITGKANVEIIPGFSSFQDLTEVYINNGSGSFTKLTSGLENINGRTAFGDLNNDTFLDAVVIAKNDIDDEVTHIYYNNGAGVFTRDAVNDPAILDVENGEVIIADIDNDNLNDIILGGHADHSTGVEPNLFMYINNGDSSFTDTRTLAPAQQLFFDEVQYPTLDTADINGDGFVDLLYAGRANSLGSSAKLLLNDGTGIFSTDAPLFNFTFATSEKIGDRVRFADLNGDTAPDFVITGNNVTKVYFNPNDGTDDFTISDQIDLGPTQGDLDLVDIDDDGDVDIVMSGSFQNVTSDSFGNVVYLNDGSGNFIKNDNAAGLAALHNASTLLIDIDNDSDLDLIVSGNSEISGEGNNAKSHIYLNDGTGNFVEGISNEIDSLIARPQGLASADVNEDGYMDFLMTGDDNNFDPVTKLYLNDGDGTFSESTSGITNLENSAAAFADLSGDGNVDLIVCGTSAASDVTEFYTGDGAGNFTLQSSVFDAFSDGSIALFDYDNDDDLDVLLSGIVSGTPATKLYENQGSGTFTENTGTSFTGLALGAITTGLIDDDVFLDFLIMGTNNADNPAIELYLNDGDGTFSTSSTSITAVQSGDVKLFDVDIDGDLDLLISGENTGVSTLLYQNDGSGVFSEVTDIHLLSLKESSISVGDIDGDTKEDVIIFGSNGQNEARVYQNNSTPGLVRWVNQAWSNGTGPTTSDGVILSDDYNTSIDGEFSMIQLIVDYGNELTISNGSTLDVQGDLDNRGTFVVESGGSLLTYSAQVVTGNPITFSRNTRFSDGRYSMVGSPVETDASITGAELGPIVYSYDETIPYNDGTEDGINRWEDATSNVLQPGIGYAAANQEVITFEGTPNDGTISFASHSRTEDASTTSNNWGWHLVSNPYPAAINLQTFLAVNSEIQGSIALWDDHGSNTGRGDNGDFLTVNGIGTVAGPNGGNFEGYIGSMQGFFIQVGAAQNGGLIFIEAMRESGNNSDNAFLRTAEIEIPKIKLAMVAEGEYSETLIGFPEDATRGIDRLYDVSKLKANQSHNLFSIIESSPFAIQGLPISEEIEIPLGIDLDVSKNITFKISELSSSLKDYKIFMKDLLTNREYEITEGNSFSQKVSAGAGQRRFSLVLREAQVLSISELALEKLFMVYADDYYINILGDHKSKTNITILNVNGQVVFEKNQVVDQVQLQILKPARHGLYMVRLESDGFIEVHKLIIK